MELGLRLRLICDDPGGWLPRVNAGLRAHGLLAADGAHPEPASARPATLLLFDDLSPQVLNAVGETSRAGRDRTLAVATTRHALRDGGVWSLLRRGASDAFAWDDIDDPIAQVAARLERWGRIDSLIETPAVRNHLIGTSPAWMACLQRCRSGGVHRRPRAGARRERHGQGAGGAPDPLARPGATKRDLVVLDCATVVPELSGSEFFGHERGAYTGAGAPRDGAFALADGGTLFLDEVGELPPAFQAQLLRAVQERTYKRVGGNTWHRTNFRLVCATNRDLPDEVAAAPSRGPVLPDGERYLPPAAAAATGEDIPRSPTSCASHGPDRPAPELDGAVRDCSRPRLPRQRARPEPARRAHRRPARRARAR